MFANLKMILTLNLIFIEYFWANHRNLYQLCKLTSLQIDVFT